MTVEPISRPMKLLPLPAVKERTGLSRSTLYEMMKAGTFPKPVKINVRKNGWIEHEVETVMQSWIQSRNGRKS